MRPGIQQRVRCFDRHLACVWSGGKCGRLLPAVARAAAVAGALLGGRFSARHCSHQAQLHSSATAQAVFFEAAVILAIAGGGAPAAGYRYAVIAALGIGLLRTPPVRPGRAAGPGDDLSTSPPQPAPSGPGPGPASPVQ